MLMFVNNVYPCPPVINALQCVDATIIKDSAVDDVLVDQFNDHGADDDVLNADDNEDK